MRVISDAVEYGLRAVVWLADHPGEPQKVREMAAGTRCSTGYLAKVMQRLGGAGIVSAQRGLHGGFTLERDPATLTILEVVEAVDPIQRITTCPLDIKSHGTRLCPLHRRIDNAIAYIEQSFRKTTIQELLDEPAESRPLCDVPVTVGGERKT